MKTLYESILDIDANIDNLDFEIMYGIWNAKNESEYKEIGKRMEKLIRNNCKIASYIKEPYTGEELKSNKYYIGFDWVLDGGPMFALDVFFKKHNRCFKLAFWWPYCGDKLRIKYHEVPIDKEILIKPKELYEANKVMVQVIDKLIKLAK